ncbi:hypothetical protein WJX81_007536 [Elliptochloris bilobata]|uniref:glucose-6-phosphate 1-epimerase n=1 Tax=Elliptochloris bilobata TaxID=381761 RepID=A0AAW1RY83_9CHLO
MATVEVDAANGLKKVVLKGPQGASAEVYLHGAHVTSWKSSAGEELIFVSKKAVFKPPKAIRGGVPVCFPQFGGFGPLQQHGFARNSAFEVVSGSADSVTLALRPDEEQLKLFQHDFLLKVMVTVGADRLEQRLSADNTGSGPLQFTTALHTYYTIDSIHNVRIEGLAGREYLDNLADKRRCTEAAPDVRFAGEVDRIYLDVPGPLRIMDGSSRGAIEVVRENLPDAVVWNPWIDKAAGMPDFGDEEYQTMICLEPAVAGSGPVELAPGATWTGAQVLSLDRLGGSKQLECWASQRWNATPAQCSMTQAPHSSRIGQTKALRQDAAPDGSKPKFSSRLMQMKFMQRGKPPPAAAAEEAALQVAVLEEPDEQAEWVVRGGAAGGCRVVAEADPRPGAAVGRLSFTGRDDTTEAHAEQPGAAAGIKEKPLQLERASAGIKAEPLALEAGTLPPESRQAGGRGVKRKLEAALEGAPPDRKTLANRMRPNIGKPPKASRYTW